MDLNLNDEQRMLQDSAERFAANSYSFEQRKANMRENEGFSKTVWKTFAELGWLALPLPEAEGGLGGKPDDVGVLMEVFGKVILIEPYLSTVVLSAGLISALGSPAQRQQFLPRVAEGELLLAFAHGEAATSLEPQDIKTSAVKRNGKWVINGRKDIVLGAPIANFLLVSARLDGTPDIGVLAVPAKADGVKLSPVTLINGSPAANILFENVSADEEALLGGATDAASAITKVMDDAVVANCAYATGAMQALLSKTIAYLNTRIQFGRPLAANQVIRHRVADMAVACEEARAITLRAALSLGEAPRARGRAASAAKIKVGKCARYVAEEAVQLHGGMGVTEELDIGFYFKSLLALSCSWDQPTATKSATKSHYEGPELMDMQFSAEDNDFREEIAAFIKDNVPADMAKMTRLTPSVFADPWVVRGWQTALHTRGWVAPAWPAEYGGPGWSPAQRYIFEQECAKAHTPLLSPMGIRMVGPVIMAFGSDEQKAHYLPRILSSDDYWCQGYSEPDAGSDLASLKTRAVADGDDYVINGTKIWTTHAHYANWMFALVRTSDGPRKQDGISFVLIDMKSPGITIRPILTMGGDHEVNQVFLDNVRIPRANLVGKEGAGWSYGKYLLEFERGGGFVASRLRQSLTDLLALKHRLNDQTAVAEAIGSRFSDLEIDLDAFEMMELRLLSVVQSGGTPGLTASLTKMIFTDLRQRIQRLAVDVLGERGLIWESHRPLYELNEVQLLEDELPVMPNFLNGRAGTIYGGSSEVQRE